MKLGINILVLLLFTSSSTPFKISLVSAAEGEDPKPDDIDPSTDISASEQRFATLLSTVRNDPSRQKSHSEKLLTNAKSIPLMGLGVGNLSVADIATVVREVFSRNELGYTLIDTAHANANGEEAVFKAIRDVMQNDEKKKIRGTTTKNIEYVHVVTKVWYTHLGYHRTLLSVKESLDTLQKYTDQVKVHLLIHWPRCYDEVEWMECQKEEDELPQNIKDIGPSPLEKKDSAFLESWRALEDVYMRDPRIESIGVSNFKLEDMEQLVQRCKIVPHIYQGPVWSFFAEPQLMQFLTRYAITYQNFHFMVSLVSPLEKGDFPVAAKYLEDMANHISTEAKLDWNLDASTMISAWMMQRGAGIVSRSTSALHILQNSPSRISEIPSLEDYSLKIDEVLHNIIHGKDIELKTLVKTTFENNSKDVVDIYWVDSRTGEKKKVIENVVAGDKQNLNSHPGHIFVAASVDGMELNKFEIKADYGGEESFTIEQEL